jgi:hypothetical protein
MKISKLFLKYSFILLVVIVIKRFVEPYAMKLYYTLHNNPDLMPDTIQQFQSIVMVVNFLFNLIIIILMIFDSKNKKSIDWIIFMITFFYSEAGIPVFLIWQIYKDLNNK